MPIGTHWVTSDAARVTYWDTSAILSALFRDDHSDVATAHARGEGIHFVSSLAWAESHAVMARLEREAALSRILIDAARDTLTGGPWRRLNAHPNWESVQLLARVWPLRGADLWHLATAKELQVDLPELTLLTFDGRLKAAAQGEGLVR